jgi:hypothetical protein
MGTARAGDGCPRCFGPGHDRPMATTPAAPHRFDEWQGINPIHHRLVDFTSNGIGGRMHGKIAIGAAAAVPLAPSGAPRRRDRLRLGFGAGDFAFGRSGS